ncbi:MAG: glycosyltransferase family 2 protein [Gemmatimonadetes bacterium]|nr:glycosyltransferase family 2 protein [Gemmatimonadota bacterium]
MPSSDEPKVYVIILNTRTKQETVECLLSLEDSTYRTFEVVVVENDSGDDSLPFIQKAVAGRVSYPLHSLESPANHGFAFGNNVGLRFAMARGDGRYYWVLNNDTIVPPDTLAVQVQAAEEDRRAGRRIGQYGLKLRYHSHPDLLQAVGGTYNKWLSITREIGNLERDERQYDRRAPRPDILIGASLFVSDEFLREVGLLGEDYFIYYEEHDWAVRGRRRGWGLRVLCNGLVYHKQGVSSGGGSGDRAKKSAFSDFYSFRNRLLFTARYHPYCLPTVYLGFLGIAWNRIRRGQWDRLPMMLRLMATFWRRPLFRSGS